MQVISPPVKVDRTDSATSSGAVTSLHATTSSPPTSESTKGRFARSVESSVNGVETDILPFFSTVSQIMATSVYLTSLPVSLEGTLGTVLSPALSVSTITVKSSTVPYVDASPGSFSQPYALQKTPSLDTSSLSENTETHVVVPSLQPSPVSSIFTTDGSPSLEHSLEVSGSVQTVSVMLESSRSVFGELSGSVSGTHHQPLDSSNFVLEASSLTTDSN